MPAQNARKRWEQPSLGVMVVQSLRDMISTGEFEPGEHLIEADIAETLGVSRGPVREALIQLEVEGLVELRRHRGAFVCELSLKDIDEVHTLRAAIERLAAERACTRMGAAEFAALDRVLTQMREATSEVTPENATLMDLHFHDVIYASCDHQRVQRVWQSIRGHVSSYLRLRNVNFPDFADVGYQEHLALRTALSLGEPAQARDAIDAHLRGAYERLKSLDLPLGERGVEGQ